MNTMILGTASKINQGVLKKILKKLQYNTHNLKPI